SARFESTSSVLSEGHRMAWAGMTIDPTKLAQLAWALAHFLWQGAVVALVLAVVLRVLRRHTPASRYAASSLSLLLIAAAPVISMSYLAAYDSGPLVIPFDPSLAQQPGWQRVLVRFS